MPEHLHDFEKSVLARRLRTEIDKLQHLLAKKDKQLVFQARKQNATAMLEMAASKEEFFYEVRARFHKDGATPHSPDGARGESLAEPCTHLPIPHVGGAAEGSARVQGARRAYADGKSAGFRELGEL